MPNWVQLESGDDEEVEGIDVPYLESDLAYNRAGALSPAQKERLRREWRHFRAIAAGFGLVIAAVGILLALAGERGAWICTGVFAVVIGLALFQFDRIVQAIQRQGAVTLITGSVQRELDYDDGAEIYALIVDESRLRLDNRADYEQFEDGGRYRVYYLPRTRYVVSGEPDSG